MTQPEPPLKSAVKPTETSLVPAQPRGLKSVRATNSEPNSRLYIFDNKPVIKKQDVHTPELYKNKKPAQASTKQEIDKNRLHPIKKLSRKFRKNGLNIIDSGFNSRFFYYIWKLEKNKNQARYGAYIALMTALAKLYGSLADLFAPMLAFIGWLVKPETPRRRTNPAVRAASWLAPAAAVAFTAFAIINISAYRPELELWINGEQVGLVASRDAAVSASRRSELDISAVLGEPYEFSGSINYKMTLVKDPEYIA